MWKTISDWFTNFVSKFFNAVDKIIDGIMATIIGAANDPYKLSLYVILGCILFDIIAQGKIGFITYLLAQLGAVIGFIKALPIVTVVFIVIVVAMFINKK